MSVYRGPVCKLCRREKQKLFLKGSRCLTAKCGIEKRQYPPGQHGQRRGRVTEYGIQLREKQKVKRAVFMTETQFRRFFKKADREDGPTGENLLIRLESRLDNVIKRLGIASSIKQARQFVLHKLILINGKVCNISSYVVRPGDEISVNGKSKDNVVIKDTLVETEGLGLPGWLEFDSSMLKGKMIRKPVRDEITISGGDINETFIVELYSK